MQLLQQQGIAHPVLWCATQSDIVHVKTAFPGLDVYDTLNQAVYGKELYPGALMDGYRKMSDDLLNQLRGHDRILAEMLITRSDPGGGFGYYEQRSHYHDYLANCLAMLERYQPDLVIFQEIPHQMWDYILYAVARLRNINCLMLLDTPVPGRMVVFRNHIDKIAPRCPTAETAVENNGQVIDDYIHRLKGKFEQGTSYQNRIAHKSRLGKHSVVDILARLQDQYQQAASVYQSWKSGIHRRKAERQPPRIHYLKEAGKSWPDSFSSQWSMEYQRFIDLGRRVNLLESYAQACEPPDFDATYIYYPLHKQPELSTVPMAGEFSDHLLALKWLLAVLPSGVKVYIKENPGQFEWHRSTFARHQTFYEELNQFDAVRIIDTGYDSYQLIDHCLCVFTAVGTSGWEAIMRNKPVIATGTCVWYGEHPAVYRASDPDAMSSALSEIVEGNVCADQYTAGFLEGFYRDSYATVTSNLHQGFLKIGQQQRSAHLAQAIADHSGNG